MVLLILSTVQRENIPFHGRNYIKPLSPIIISLSYSKFFLRKGRAESFFSTYILPGQSTKNVKLTGFPPKTIKGKLGPMMETNPQTPLQAPPSKPRSLMIPLIILVLIISGFLAWVLYHRYQENKQVEHLTYLEPL